MNNYPEAVEKIVDDYLQRLKRQLRSLPASEQQEFLLEIRSHVYDAYQEAANEDVIMRILGVLRRLGEPAEVVSDRLPKAMMRSGASRSAPAYIIGGILIALFGIPLGFGGAAFVIGVLVASVGLVAALHAAAFVTLLASALFLTLALTRIYESELWNRLVTAGVIQMNPEAASVLDQLPVAAQASAMIMMACIFALVGIGLLWLGRRSVRGLGFLFNLVFDKVRQLSKRARKIAEQKWPHPFTETANGDV